MTQSSKPFTPEEKASYRGWMYGSTLDWASRILVAVGYPVAENRWYVDAVCGIHQQLKKRFPDGVPISHSSLAKRAEKFKNKAQASELSRAARDRHLEHARLKRVVIFDIEIPKPRERKGKDKRAQTKYTDYLTPAAVWAQDCEKRIKDADRNAWKNSKYRGEKRREILAEAVKMLPSFEDATEDELPDVLREERCGACEVIAKEAGDDTPKLKKDCPGHPLTMDELVKLQESKEVAARRRIMDILAGEHLTDETEIDARVAAVSAYYGRQKAQLEKDCKAAIRLLSGMRAARLVTPIRFRDAEEIADEVCERFGTETEKEGPADWLFDTNKGKADLTPSVQAGNPSSSPSSSGSNGFKGVRV